MNLLLSRSYTRLIVLFVCFSLLAMSQLLVGCGGSASTTTTAAAPPPPAPPSPPSPPPPPPPSNPTPPSWSPTTSSLPAPPAQEPPPPPSSDFPLTISSPGNNAMVTSPANLVASATPANPILGMRVYVDGQAMYWTFNSSMNTNIWLAPGAHTLEIMAEDKKGFISASALNVSVVTPQAPGVSDIQTLPGWQSCSALFPPGFAA